MTTARPIDWPELNPLLRTDELVRVGAAIAIAAAAFAILILPVETRDVVLLAGAGLWTIVALADFPSAWIFFILVLPFVHLAGSMFGIAQLTFVRIILGCAVCVFPFRLTGGTLPKALIRDGGVVAFALFVAANVMSAVRLPDTGAILRALSYSEPLIFLALTYCVVRQRPENFRTIAAAITIGGVVVVALGLVEMTTQRSIVGMLGIDLPGVLDDPQVYLEQDRFGLGGRVMSTMVQPVYAALYFAVWLFVSVYCLATAPKPWRGLLLAVVPVGVVVLVATGSRGPLLAIAPAVAIVAVSGRWRTSVSLPMLAAGILIAVCLTLFVPQFLPFLTASLTLDQVTPENVNVLGRIDVTNRLLDLFWLSPLWGIGPGGVQHTALAGATEFAGLGGQENQYAIVLADAGLIGGAAYLWFMIAAIGGALKVARGIDREVKIAGLLALALLVFYFAAVSTATCLTQLPNCLVMIAYGGVVAVRDARERSFPPLALRA